MIGSPSKQDGPILHAWDFPPWSRKKKVSFGHMINPLLTKLVLLSDLDLASVHENPKKNLTNIRPIFPHAWTIKCINARPTRDVNKVHLAFVVKGN